MTDRLKIMYNTPDRVIAKYIIETQEKWDTETPSQRLDRFRGIRLAIHASATKYKKEGGLRHAAIAL